MPEGYTLKDLIKPDRIKVQKALSGIINLQKFRESVQDEYDGHVQKSVRGEAGWVGAAGGGEPLCADGGRGKCRAAVLLLWQHILQMTTAPPVQ